MNRDADELLRLWKVDQEGSSSPIDAVIGRRLRADLGAQAEAAGGELLLDLGGGWSIGAVTEAHLTEREAAAAAARNERMAAARARRRRRRG